MRPDPAFKQLDMSSVETCPPLLDKVFFVDTIKGMTKSLPLSDKDGEVRELTTKDFKHFKTADKVLPKELIAVLPKRGRPASETPKKAVNIRLSPDVLTTFKATGKGWQTRIDNALREWLKEHN
jgi:uncharacterized protein (DUF4415 family)